MKSVDTIGALPNSVGAWWRQGLARLGLTVIATAFAVLAAYYGTIGELKLALAEKADRQAVENIDLRLARIEVVINDRLLTKDEFYHLRDELLVRLARMESELRIKP